MVSALSATLFSRSWSGPESEMWLKLVDQLENASQSTKLQGLKSWIDKEIPQIKERIVKAKAREEEEKIRGFRG